MSVAIPILVYHRVHADDDPTMPEMRPDTYCGHVTVSQFRQHMTFLAEQGYRTVSHDHLADWLDQGQELPARPVAIDFDDNRLNVLDNAFPIMRDHGFAGTVFVITELANGVEIGMNQYPALEWDDLAGLVEAGWGIEAHTKTHVTFGSSYAPPRDEAHIIDELGGAQAVIREKLGVPANHFAYPTGTSDEEAERWVRKFYRTARLWQEERRPPPADPYEYVTGRTDPYRLNGININARLGFDDFRGVLEGSK